MRINKPIILFHSLAYKIIVLAVLMLFGSFTSTKAQCTLSCQDNVQIALNNSGEAVIIPQIMLAAYNESCYDTLIVEILDANDINIGNIVNCNYLGQTLLVNVYDPATTNSCQGSIFIVDNLSPEIAIDTQYVHCYENDYSIDVVPIPDVTDNCSDILETDMTYDDESIDLDCLTEVAGHLVTAKIERTWYATDDQGNSTSQVQLIFVERSNVNDVVFPPNLDDIELPSLDCNGLDPLDTDVTGWPSIDGYKLTLDGSCEFVITYSDQEFQLCSENDYQIIRTWQVVDWCTDEFRIDAQVIKVKDTTAPLLNCPSDITVGTNYFDCDATVNLPNAIISDDCSNFSQEISWVFGSGNGPFFNIPLGTYPVTYDAVDDCGNTSTCTINVTVVDDDPPSAICNQDIDVALQPDGTVVVNAFTFDDQSYDNCTLDYYEVSRDGINFSDTVHFSCNDVGNGPHEVIFRVYDINGLSSECYSYVYVEDNIFPEITCPSTTVISCDANFNDLSLTGEPDVYDNCGVDTVWYSDIISLNCSVGTISRTWYVKDNSNHISTCNQIISIVDNTPIQVVFPDDITLDQCGAITTPDITGDVIISGDDCEVTGADYYDTEINESAPACYTIYRHWTVINECVYNPDDANPQGIWEHIQEINIIDENAPIIECVEDMSVDLNGSTCEGFIDVPIPTIQDCSPDISIYNNSSFSDSSIGSASGTYPPGIYYITYTIQDGCGNQSQCSFYLEVRDGKAPTAVCNYAISIILEETGDVEINANLINNNSWDNCTAEENLQIELSKILFTCADVGENYVTMTVTDEEGNSSFCTTQVNIQDNLNVCSSETFSVSGAISNINDDFIDSVTVNLTGYMDKVTLSNESGYLFEECLEEGDYTVTPYKNVGVRNGVSSYDLIVIGRHLLETNPFDSPYQYIASDVNNSGSVTGLDVVIIRQLILHNIDEFPLEVPSWRFIVEDYEFTDENNPLSDDFPESINVDYLAEDNMNNNFIGIKMGDPTFSASNTFGDELDIRNGNDYKLKYIDKEIIAGDEFSMVFELANSKLLGCQGAIGFNKNAIDIYSVESLLSPNRGDAVLKDNEVIFSYGNGVNDFEENSQLFIIHFIANRSGFISDYIELNDNMARSEAYNTDMQIGNLELLGVEWTEDVEELLLRISPNPFTDRTTVLYSNLSKENDAILLIYNSFGQIIKEVDITNRNGKIILNRDDFGSSGIYFVKIIDGHVKNAISRIVVD